MPDKRLRMVAELTDRASGPMRKIRESAASIRETPGMRQARAWMTGFNKEADRFVKGGGGIVDAMSGMGIGGLAAAASIGTLVSRFKELGTHTLAMKELGREVGLTTDQVNQFNHAANHFGFDPDRMQGALDHFAGLMPEFRRGYGELNNVLARQPDLIKRLRLEDTKTQLQDIFRFLGTMPNPQDRIKFEEQIFGQNVEPLFAEGADGFEKQLDRYAKTLSPITKEMEDQAAALRDAITDFNDAVGNLETKYGPQILGSLKEGAIEVKHMFDDVVKTVEAVRKWSEHPFQSTFDAMKDKGDEINDRNAYRWRRHFGSGDFAPATSVADADRRLGAMDAESASLAGKDDEKSRIRLEELGEAAKQLRDYVATAVPDAEHLADLRAQLAEAEKRIADTQSRSRLGPGVESPVIPAMRDAADGLRDEIDALERSRRSPDAPPAPSTPAPSKPPANWQAPPPVLHPDDDRLSRARASDADAWSQQQDIMRAASQQMGELDKPVTHLVGTLKTAAADAGAGAGMFRQAAFHPASLDGGASALDPVATIAAGTREGFLAAYRELSGLSGDDASTARPGGFTPAAFHPGGGTGGGNPALGGGGFGGDRPNLSGGDAQGAEADHIREAARKYGIDPRVAVAVARSEGLGVAWGTGMDHGTSFGAFQLHVGGGLGDIYQRETGRDPRDQANAFDMDDWALKYASKNGWGPWHGAARIGVHGMAGIGGRPVEGANLGEADGGGFAGKGDAVGIATSMLGFGERQSAQALGHIMHAGEWCADFVNGVIEKSGGKGSGSAMASSFARWGKAVSIADAKRGDVILENAHGRGINHVGMVEGVDRDKAGRVTGIHMISGNYGHMVRRNLEPFGIIAGLRRGNEAGGQALRDAAGQLRGAAADQRAAASKVSGSADPGAKPSWYHPEQKHDLAEERRKAGLTGPQSVRVDGGVRADIHLHDGQVHKASARTHGVVSASAINLRRAPQRTQSA